jgi:hypothetical protein
LTASPSREDTDAWTRAFAEENAKRAGMSVRDWLDQYVAQETARLTSPHPAVETLELVEPVIEDADLGEALNAEAAYAISAIDDPFEDELALDAPWEEPVVAVTQAALEAMDPPQDDWADPALDSAPEDAADAVIDAETSEDATQRLDGLEFELRQVREQVESAEQHAQAVQQEAASTHQTHPAALATTGSGQSEAIERLGRDLALLAEVVECGFERIEVLSEKQMADLRGEVVQRFDELGSRIGELGRPSADIEPLELAATAELESADLDEPLEIEEPTSAEVAPNEPLLAASSELESDEFDEPLEMEDANLNHVVEAAAVETADSATPETAWPSLQRDEEGAFVALDHSEPALEAAPLEASSSFWADELVGEAQVEPRQEASDTWPEDTLFEPTEPATASERVQAPARGKISVLPWLGFRRNQSARKTA